MAAHLTYRDGNLEDAKRRCGPFPSTFRKTPGLKSWASCNSMLLPSIPGSAKCSKRWPLDPLVLDTGNYFEYFGGLGASPIMAL